MKIRALRQFSHYHAGNFSQFEVRDIPESWATALIEMELAEEVRDSQEGLPESEAGQEQPEARRKKK